MAPATQPAIFTGTSRIYCDETRVYLIRECMKLIPRHWLVFPDHLHVYSQLLQMLVFQAEILG